MKAKDDLGNLPATLTQISKSEAPISGATVLSFSAGMEFYWTVREFRQNWLTIGFQGSRSHDYPESPKLLPVHDLKLSGDHDTGSHVTAYPNNRHSSGYY